MEMWAYSVIETVRGEGYRMGGVREDSFACECVSGGVRRCVPVLEAVAERRVGGVGGANRCGTAWAVSAVDGVAVPTGDAR